MSTPVVLDVLSSNCPGCGEQCQPTSLVPVGTPGSGYAWRSSYDHCRAPVELTGADGLAVSVLAPMHWTVYVPEVDLHAAWPAMTGEQRFLVLMGLESHRAWQQEDERQAAEDALPPHLKAVVELLRSRPRPLGPPAYRKQPIPRALRKAVFERDAYRCVDCSDWKDLSVDHVIPESLGGLTELDNLATRCMPCNLRKGVKLLG